MSVTNQVSDQQPLDFKPTAQNKFDAIITVLSPIVLVILVSLSINYAVNPVAPMIPITSNFSITLPVLICAPTGCVAAIFFTVQLVRHQAVKESFEKCIVGVVHHSDWIRNKIRHGVHPGGRDEGETIEKHKETYGGFINELKEKKGLIPVEFPTRDHIKLGGYWSENGDPDAPTVVLFHGNNQTIECFAELWTPFYQALGFNILGVEYRGYGISAGEAAGENQEMEAYFDIEAAIKFLYAKGVNYDKVVAHGLSLGGAYAAAAGYFFNVQNVVLDHTFTAVAEVASNSSPISSGLASRSVQAAYIKGSADKDPTIPNAQPLVTDGFDSLGKVKKMAGEIFVIRGETDDLMPTHFGDTLISAKYPEEKHNSRMATILGGHNHSHLFMQDAGAKRKFQAFLMERGLISNVLLI